MAARNRLPPWHEELRLRDGRELLIRPVRPDDAGPLREGFALLQPDEVRHRFLRQQPDLSAQQADRLCRPDPRKKFERLRGDVLANNLPMLALADSLGFKRTDGAGDPTLVRVVLDL